MSPAARRRIAVAATALLLAAGAAPATGGDAPTRVPTVTRSVKLFQERETALAEAIRAGDKSALAKLLSEDFELRAGARAGRPVPRDDYVSDVMRSRDGGGDIAAMAVHDLGETAIVSFTQGNRGGALFVVDVWRKGGGDWQLAIRYASPAGDARYAVPGAGAEAPEIPKKY
jgi:hypothetical protein